MKFKYIVLLFLLLVVHAKGDAQKRITFYHPSQDYPRMSLYIYTDSADIIKYKEKLLVYSNVVISNEIQEKIVDILNEYFIDYKSVPLTRKNIKDVNISFYNKKEFKKCNISGQQTVELAKKIINYLETIDDPGKKSLIECLNGFIEEYLPPMKKS